MALVAKTGREEKVPVIQAITMVLSVEPGEGFLKARCRGLPMAVYYDAVYYGAVYDGAVDAPCWPSVLAGGERTVSGRRSPAAMPSAYYGYPAW